MRVLEGGQKLGSPHSTPQQKFKQRASHGISTRSTHDLCGSHRIWPFSKAQGTFYNQGYPGTGEPVLDFWYVNVSPSYLFLEVDGTKREILQGHQWHLLIEEAGGPEKRFLEEFGNIVRWNGVFGVRPAVHRTCAGVP